MSLNWILDIKCVVFVTSVYRYKYLYIFIWWVDLSQQPNTLQASHSLFSRTGWRERQEGSGFKAMTICNTGFFQHSSWTSLHEHLVSKPIFFNFRFWATHLLLTGMTANNNWKSHQWYQYNTVSNTKLFGSQKILFYEWFIFILFRKTYFTWDVDLQIYSFCFFAS